MENLRDGVPPVWPMKEQPFDVIKKTMNLRVYNGRLQQQYEVQTHCNGCLPGMPRMEWHDVQVISEPEK